MNFKEQLEQTMARVKGELDKINNELSTMEQDFANVKLNPYGITSIDFGKRQDLATDALKMEGVIMGLTLALETYSGATESASAE
jgi:hypothetical protein